MFVCCVDGEKEVRNGNEYEKNKRKWTSTHYQRTVRRNDYFGGDKGKLNGHGCRLTINNVSGWIFHGKYLFNWIQSVSVPHFLSFNQPSMDMLFIFTLVFTTISLFLPNLSSYVFSLQPSQKTFRTKRTLAVKLKQNKPIPHWIRLRTDSTIRYNAKRRHWRRTKLGI